jgi:membrane protease YdiL (CAAX protease family)
VKGNPENNIRPTRIRIVNPTPKSSQPERLIHDPKPKKQDKINLLILMLVGSIILLILHLLDVWQTLLPGIFNWKHLTLIQAVCLLLLFILPTIIYLLIKPQEIEKLNLKINPITGLLSLLIGFPFAYIMAAISFIISIVLHKIGLFQNIIIFGKEMQLFPINNSLYRLVFILIICIIPAIVSEIPLRGILLDTLLVRKRQINAILLCAFITGLLTFSSQEFLPYFGLGWLTSLIMLYHQSITATILCHFSFNLIYYYLIMRVKNLNLSILNWLTIDLERLLPIIGKVLIATTIFVPIFVVLSHTKRINPIFDSDKIIARHSKKTDGNNTLITFALIGLVIIFILYVTVIK